MEMARDEVRVMTVHGAKGLEAPIVILADTTTPPQGWHPPRLLPLPPRSGAGTPHRWSGPAPRANDVGPMAAAREAALDEARDEYRRLLYVAMTRAIDRLIVCGVEGETQAAGGLLVRSGRAARSRPALRRRSRPTTATATVLRYRKAPDAAAAPRPQPADAPAAIALPGWLTQTIAERPARAAPIKPSGFVDDPDAAGAAAAAARRGGARSCAATSCTG